MADLRFGADAKLYRNTGTFGTPVWAEVKNVNDALNVGLTYAEADATIRGVGVTQSEPTLLGLELSFRMLEDLDDTQFTAIRTAALAKTILDMLTCSGPVATAGETYVRKEFKVTGFNKGEPLNGINTYDVVMKPCFSTNPLQAGVTPLA